MNPIKDEVVVIKVVGGTPVKLSKSAQYLEIGDIVVKDSYLYIFEGNGPHGEYVFNHIKQVK